MANNSATASRNYGLADEQKSRYRKEIILFTQFQRLEYNHWDHIGGIILILNG